MSEANTFLKVWHALIFSKYIKGFLYTPSPRGEGRGVVILYSMSVSEFLVLGGTALHNFSMSHPIWGVSAAAQLSPAVRRHSKLWRRITPSHVGGGRGWESKNSIRTANSLLKKPNGPVAKAVCVEITVPKIISLLRQIRCLPTKRGRSQRPLRRRRQL